MADLQQASSTEKSHWMQRPENRERVRAMAARSRGGRGRSKVGRPKTTDATPKAANGNDGSGPITYDKAKYKHWTQDPRNADAVQLMVKRRAAAIAKTKKTKETTPTAEPTTKKTHWTQRDKKKLAKALKKGIANRQASAAIASSLGPSSNGHGAHNGKPTRPYTKHSLAKNQTMELAVIGATVRMAALRDELDRLQIFVQGVGHRSKN